MSARSKSLLAMLAIAIVGFAVYLPSLSGPFIWDDLVLVRDNVYLRTASSLGGIFTVNAPDAVSSKHTFFRPLQFLSYFFDRLFFGSSPRGHHLTNIGLHIGVALLLFWLAMLLFRDLFVGAVSALLFVVHPVHTEAIMYISGRADPLSALFIIAGLILYIRSSPAATFHVCVSLSALYLSALLSRESALIFPLLCALYSFIWKKPFSKPIFTVLGVITVGYLMTRAIFFAAIIAPVGSASALFERIPGAFVALAEYLRLLFFPVSLHMEYGNWTFPWSSPKAIIGLAAFFTFAYIAFKRRDDRPLFFSIIWFFITLFPAANIIPVNAFMAEHWLYLPSFGFFLIVALFARRVFISKGLRIGTGLVLSVCLIGWSSVTVAQAGYWGDPLVFYSRTLAYAPESWRLYSNLGNLYMEEGRLEEAIGSFKKAIAAQGGVGRSGAAPSARERTKSEDAYYNLGNAYNKAGRSSEAIAAFEAALAMAPRSVKTLNNLGNAYRGAGRDKEALELFRRAIAEMPRQAVAYYNSGITYAKIGMRDDAVRSFENAIELDPKHADAYNNLAGIFVEENRYLDAERLLRAATANAPRDGRAYYNGAVIAYGRGRYDEAQKRVDEARKRGFRIPEAFERALREHR